MATRVRPNIEWTVLLKVDSEFNFGFEIVSEEDINKPMLQAAEASTRQYAEEAQKLREMILPLLHNLAKKPESEYIKWPNRSKTINEFITKMFLVSGLAPTEEDYVD